MGKTKRDDYENLKTQPCPFDLHPLRFRLRLDDAGVVQSGLYFAATAVHLAIALLMLLVTGRMWANEGESP